MGVTDIPEAKTDEADAVIRVDRICRDPDPPRWDRRWVGDLDRRCRWTRRPRRG